FRLPVALHRASIRMCGSSNASAASSFVVMPEVIDGAIICASTLGKTMHLIKRILAGSWIACAAIATAATPQLHELGRLVPGFEQPGIGGFAIADFDGDGRDDLV